MDDLARTVAKLQAAEDIRHLKARYARVCDTGYTPSEMVPLFTKDAVWDGGRFGRYEGIDAISAFFDGVSARHHLGAPLHDRARDRGERRPRHRERHLVSPGSPARWSGPDGPKAVWLTGGYADRYARRTAPGGSPR